VDFMPNTFLTKKTDIQKHHSDLKYIFWPDLASAHYTIDTVTWLTENVHYVPKRLNPPNVPQARPIEISGVVWPLKFTKVTEKLKQKNS
jgi:hypothetical protein